MRAQAGGLQGGIEAVGQDAAHHGVEEEGVRAAEGVQIGQAQDTSTPSSR